MGKMAHEILEEEEFDIDSLFERVREDIFDRSEKDDLFKYIMNGEWMKILEMFDDFKLANRWIINRNMETAVHVAVAAGQTNIVSEMVKSLRSEEHASEVLAMKNESGNTALHLAAAMGNVDMCNSIAKVDPELIDARNKEDDSPLVLAARHGQAEAFFSLLSTWKTKHEHHDPTKDTDYYRPFRGYDGNNILHAAISGEYFSFALKIIGEYPHLVDGYNTEGSTPLHVLAANPNVFESGNSFGLLDRIIYNCIILSGFEDKSDSKNKEDDNSHKFPENYKTCIRLFCLPKMLLLFLAKLLNITKQRSVDDKNRTTITQRADVENQIDKPKKSESIGEPKKWKGSPFLSAAKRGVIEMVEEILKKYPTAIRDLDSDGKNAVLLAVENRQIEVYKLILDKAKFKESVLRQVDNEGNSVLHLAAFLGKVDPWNIYGPALQMQWEYKWYKFVKKSISPNVFIRHNKKGETAKELLLKSHKKLVDKGSEWLKKTSESCSVVAALNATVAFATISQVPGGLNDQNGAPKLEEKATFRIFSISALIALGFSVTALVYFLSIITSRFQQKEFHKLLPRKLLMGLSALFVSIVSILVTFCCGHIFIVEKNVKPYLYPVYVVTTLPACIFVMAQLSLYFDLYTSTFRNQPPHPDRKIRGLL